MHMYDISGIRRYSMGLYQATGSVLQIRNMAMYMNPKLYSLGE